MSEFESIIRDKTRFRKIMESAFRSVDVDGSGFLDESELRQVLIQIAKDIGVDSPTNEEIVKIMEVIDENGDGQLSKSEFQNLIEQVLDLMVDYGDS